MAPAEPPAGPTTLIQPQRDEVYKALWETVRREHGQDMKAKGIDWEAMRARYQPAMNGVPDDMGFNRVLMMLLAELKDSHSYLDFPDPYDARMQPPVQVMMDGNSIVVSQVVPGSTAELAGLAPDQRVVAVDGLPVDKAWARHMEEHSDSTPYRSRWNGARTLLYGLPDTDVDIVVFTHEGKLLPVRLRRDTAPNRAPAFATRTLPGGILYVGVGTFGGDPTTDSAVAALQKAAVDKVPGVILDLRGNGGGRTDLPVRLAGALTDQATPFGYDRFWPSGETRPLMIQPVAHPYTGPLLVLSDPSCLSACDTMAAWVPRSGRGKLVGEPSGGAAFNNATFELPHGYHVHTSAKMEGLGPDKEPIEGHPGEVAYPVAPTAADWINGRDAALEKAIELLTAK